MAAEPARRWFTVAEYYRMAEAGILKPHDRVELIEGEIIQMAPIGEPHASEVDRFAHRFIRALNDRAQVRIQGPLRLSDYSEPGPDLIVLRPREDSYRAHHPRAADVFLVVEIADTSLPFDRNVKLPLYAREGIPEVWLVEIGPDQLSVHRNPSPTGYRTVQVLHRGDTVFPQAFPDVSFAVADLLG